MEILSRLKRNIPENQPSIIYFEVYWWEDLRQFVAHVTLDWYVDYICCKLLGVDSANICKHIHLEKNSTNKRLWSNSQIDGGLCSVLLGIDNALSGYALTYSWESQTPDSLASLLFSILGYTLLVILVCVILENNKGARLVEEQKRKHSIGGKIC